MKNEKKRKEEKGVRGGGRTLHVLWQLNQMTGWRLSASCLCYAYTWQQKGSVLKCWWACSRIDIDNHGICPFIYPHAAAATNPLRCTWIIVVYSFVYLPVLYHLWSGALFLLIWWLWGYMRFNAPRASLTVEASKSHFGWRLKERDYTRSIARSS